MTMSVRSGRITINSSITQHNRGFRKFVHKRGYVCSLFYSKPSLELIPLVKVSLDRLYIVRTKPFSVGLVKKQYIPFLYKPNFKRFS